MHLNQQHPSVKFTHKISNEAVEFLDTTVYIDKNNQLQTKLYRKPTDRQNYLHQTSHHPEKRKTNIPFSQALRIRLFAPKKQSLTAVATHLKLHLSKEATLIQKSRNKSTEPRLS